jgi:periplasmic divalent cation tolerance protein
MNEAMIIFCSVPDLATGRSLADVLLNEKAAACVAILPGVESHYVWQGKREATQEHLLLIKAMADQYPTIEALIKNQHPYECPEIIAVSAEKISPEYLAWLKTA